MENMMLLIYQDFITENLTVRFTIPVFSVIFKNSAAITNTLPGQDTTLTPPPRFKAVAQKHHITHTRTSLVRKPLQWSISKDCKEPSVPLELVIPDLEVVWLDMLDHLVHDGHVVVCGLALGNWHQQHIISDVRSCLVSHPTTFSSMPSEFWLVNFIQ